MEGRPNGLGLESTTIKKEKGPRGTRIRNISNRSSKSMNYDSPRIRLDGVFVDSARSWQKHRQLFWFYIVMGYYCLMVEIRLSQRNKL